MRMVFAAIGAVLLLPALASFFRSFWRAPPKRERDEYSPEGSSSAFGTDSNASGHDGGGGDGGAGH
jgi:hypothetical protein